MNIGTLSGRATGKTMPTGDQVSDAVGDLENPIHDAVTMAKIVSHLVETMLAKRQPYMGTEAFILSAADGDILTWAIYRAEMLAKEAQDGWETANEIAFELRRAS